eukprot:351539-Rhodomonas_salina.1
MSQWRIASLAQSFKGCPVWCPGSRVQGPGSRVWGSRVWGVGCGVWVRLPGRTPPPGDKFAAILLWLFVDSHTDIHTHTPFTPGYLPVPGYPNRCGVWGLGSRVKGLGSGSRV